MNPRERAPARGWPGGATMAVVLTFDYHGEVGAPTMPGGKVNYQELTERQYGALEGVWRIMDLLGKYRVKASFLTCGATVERYPDSIIALTKEGHEVGSHGYLHEGMWDLSEEVERGVIKKCVEAVSTVAGVPPIGWRSPKCQPSEKTPQVLVENGYIWRSDFLNGDLPYFIETPAGRLVELPYTWTTDDAALYGMPDCYPYGTPRDVLGVWQDEFDVLYEESRKSPRMMVLCMHPFLTGRPARSRALARFIEYAGGHDGVWFARGGDVARQWLAGA